MHTKVVITGMGVVTPVGNDIPTFWNAICNGRSGIRPITAFDAADFSVRIGGQCEDCLPEDISAKDARRYDRFVLHALAASDQAWKQSGLDISKSDPFRCGAVVGTGIGGLLTFEEEHKVYLEKGPKRISPFMIPKLLMNMASGMVAMRLGLMGPNKALVTACATGLQCIMSGADLIRMGRADVVLAGGAEAAMAPLGIGGFASMRALSRRNEEPERASRPFDRDRDGFVMSEGAGVVVLESEEHARARGAEILAELAGYGETSDAYHIAAPRPDGSGVIYAIRAALNDARINPADVQYVNAHGTSTKHNDAVESMALREIFGLETMPPVSSTKSMIGHLLGAAGAVEAIVCVLSIRDGILTPSINYDTPDPECAINLVANEARQGNVAVALSNSLGFGGHNASGVFRRYDGRS